MNDRILNHLKSENQEQKQLDYVVKLLVFSMGKLTLSLPVEKVSKVTKYVPIHGSGMSYVNLTHIGRQEFTIVDLHQKLFNKSLDELHPDGGYFILTKSKLTLSAQNEVAINAPTQEENLGIRVIESPILIDVAFSNIRTLPRSYRYADTLEIASHVAVIPQEDKTTKTIFILDLEHLI